MTLQDDITRYLNDFSSKPVWTANNPIIPAVAAAFERDYYLVKLADLPEVVDAGGGYGRCGLIGTPPGFSAETSRQRALEYLAVAEHLEARESEAAVLARRRDELAQKFAPRFGDLKPNWYGNVSAGLQRAIDHIIETDSRATS